MRRKTFPILVLAVTAWWVGCNAIVDESGLVTIEGVVLDTDNEPIPDAFVRIQPSGREVETDGTGRYSVVVEIDSSMQVTISASKNGFTTASTTVFVVAERTIQAPVLRMQRSTDEAPESGLPSNILLREQSAQRIGVKESGAQEVARIVFQLADSIGRPVTVDHAVDVHFTLGAQPGGGEFIHPATARTDNQGRVTVNLSSGTRAGAVQIIAEATAGGRIIRSKPVSVAIHGGLPDQAHFSLGPETFNFPGLLAYGMKNPVSVVVGDKFANPVREGTVVYFTSDYCVVEGSTATDAQGQGTVNFISANPLPPRGIAVVTASTADEDSETVSTRIPVVLTGSPWIIFSDPWPVYAELGRTYEVTISDRNGNPLVEDTKIAVRAEGTKVKAVGHTDVTLGKTTFFDANGDGDILDYEDVVRGPGITIFTFRAVADLEAGGVGDPALEAIVITVTGPNGNLEVALTPQETVVVSRQAVLDRMPDGRQVVRLEQ